VPFTDDAELRVMFRVESPSEPPTGGRCERLRHGQVDPAWPTTCTGRGTRSRHLRMMGFTAIADASKLSRRPGRASTTARSR
jgi:hypothetical protein